jgi:hypothetical protein
LPLLDDAARVHDDDPLGELGDDAHVVRDQHDRRRMVALEAPHQLEDLGLDRDVERRRRLVRDQERRVTGEGHRDHHPLPHPARELVRIRVRPPPRIGNADLPEQLDGALLRGSSPDRLVRPELLRDLPADRVDRGQGRHRILEDHGDVGATHGAHLTGRQLHQVAPAQQDLPFDDGVRVTDQPHHGHHRDGLAGSGLADDAQRLTLADRERDAVHGPHNARLSVETDPQVADLEQWRLLKHVGLAGRARRRAGRRPRSPGRRRTPRT